MYFNGSFAELPSDAEFSAGARPTFAESFTAGLDDQMRGHSMIGPAADFENVEAEQFELVRKLTGEQLYPAMSFDFYTALAASLEGKASPDEEQRLKSFDTNMARLAEIRKAYPEILDYEQMWDEVKRRAQTAEGAADDMQSRAGLSGYLGDFIGRMAGSMTYRDPINLLSLGLGGFGRTMLYRMAVEAGYNAGAETLDQWLGVQRNRELLGLHHGWQQALTDIALAGAVGGAFQGGGELVARGAKRLLHGPEAPIKPKAPVEVRALHAAAEAEDAAPKSRLGATRLAEGVHRAELRSAIEALNSPFRGEPVTRDALMSSVSTYTLSRAASDRMFEGSATPLDQLLDKVDPGRSTKFAGTVEHANRQVRKLTREADDTQKQIGDVEARVAELEAAPGANIAALRAKVAELDKQIEEVPTSGVGARKRKQRLQRLEKEKKEVIGEIGEIEARAADTIALAGAKAALGDRLNDIRLKRALVVSATERNVPAAQAAGLDRQFAATDLLSEFPSDGPSLRLARVFADGAVERQKVLDGLAPPKERVVRDEAKPDGPEKVDVGAGELVELDMEIVVGVDAEGAPVTGRVRDFLEDLDDDDALVRQMKECIL